LTLSGKIDYAKLCSLECALEPCEIESESSPDDAHMQVIKRVCPYPQLLLLYFILALSPKKQTVNFSI